MIRPHALLKKFERAELSRPLSLQERLGIAAGMYHHACLIGAFPRRDPLEGLDHVIERTRRIHAVKSPSRPPRPGV
jgi:hypothetical protein